MRESELLQACKGEAFLRITHQHRTIGDVMQRFQEAAERAPSSGKLVSMLYTMGVTFVKVPQSALQPKRPKAGNSNGGSHAPSPQGGAAPTTCGG